MPSLPRMLGRLVIKSLQVPAQLLDLPWADPSPASNASRKQMCHRVQVSTQNLMHLCDALYCGETNRVQLISKQISNTKGVVQPFCMFVSAWTLVVTDMPLCYRRPCVSAGLYSSGPSGDGHICSRAVALWAMGQCWKASGNRLGLPILRSAQEWREAAKGALPSKAESRAQPWQVSQLSLCILSFSALFKHTPSLGFICLCFEHVFHFRLILGK